MADEIKEKLGFASKDKVDELEKRIEILEDKKQIEIRKEFENKKNELKGENEKLIKEELEKLNKEFKEKVESIAERDFIKYLNERNKEYLEDYKNIEKNFISAKEETINILRAQNEKLNKETEDKSVKIKELKEKIEQREKEAIYNESLSQELKEANEKISTLESEINDKKIKINNLEEDKIELNSSLEILKEENAKLKIEINSQENDVNNLGSEKENLSNQLIEANEKVTNLESQVSFKNTEIEDKQKQIDGLNEELKEKDEIINNLKNENQKDKENTLNETEEIKNRLNDFIEKIEIPYKNLLEAIKENSKADEIVDFLKAKSNKNLSESMIIFSLINEDALARKIATFYSERKEIMQEEDFKLIKEVNKVYQEEKPWGILYAEPEGEYLSSLVRDRRSSDIYKTFIAMYSPAYRKDEDGNSPLRGIVDGKK